MVPDGVAQVVDPRFDGQEDFGSELLESFGQSFGSVAACTVVFHVLGYDAE